MCGASLVPVCVSGRVGGAVGQTSHIFTFFPQTKTSVVRKVERIRNPTLGDPSPHFGVSSRESFQIKWWDCY